MKACVVCCEAKPAVEFYVSSSTGRPYSRCKECWKARRRAQHARNPRAAVAQTRAWQLANPTRHRRLVRNSYLQRTYGVTAEWYDATLAAQGGKCAACGSEDPGYRFGTFMVDHDHASGRPRALLCLGCNTAIGHAGDSPDRLLALAAYLLRFQDLLGGVVA